MERIVCQTNRKTASIKGSRRIVLTTAGSLGDLYPFVAIAIELQKRGHDVVLATSQCYQHKIESLGLEFQAVRPDSDWLSDHDKVRRLSHPRFGLLRVGREWLMPALRESYHDTLAVAEGADLLVTMLATYATRLVAEKTGTPWVSVVHIPLGFYSAYDPPILDVAPFLSSQLRSLGPVFWRPLFWLGKRISRFIAKPWYQLRAEIGLPPSSEGNPLVDSHSPRLVLALFSALLADQQQDWPPRTLLTGFPFFDMDGTNNLPMSLSNFLDKGEPPIVFTLGSAVSMNAGKFYEDSAAAARLLNRRAVLIVGKGNQQFQTPLSDDMIAVEYAPFGELFSRAAAVVHHGGVGTTGLVMRAGIPMLVVPCAWDQPDNAERVTRLGIARTIPKSRYTPIEAANELRKLLDHPMYSRRAKEVAEIVSQEEGVMIACDALEQLL